MLCCAVTGELRPVIQELNVQGDLKNYTVSQRCHVAFHLSSEITGFQDIQFHTNATGGGLILCYPSSKHFTSLGCPSTLRFTSWSNNTIS